MKNWTNDKGLYAIFKEAKRLARETNLYASDMAKKMGIDPQDKEKFAAVQDGIIEGMK